MLAEFNGTILLVSHDRYLIDALATQIWDVQPGQMTVFEGNYQEYVQAREAAKQAERDEKNPPAKSAPARPDAKAAAKGPSGSGNGKPRLSEYERVRRLAQVEQRIHELEIRLVNLSGELGEASAAGAVERVADLGAAYNIIEADLNAALEEWELLLE